jgi:hypothetical protein
MPDIDRSRSSDVAFFLALMATTLALGAALAHAYSLANKIGLDAEAYLHAQRAYDNWHFVGFALPLQIIGMIAVIVRHRGEGRILRPAAVALVLCLAAQIVFWIWTFPVNQATENWTQMPDTWQALRAQWEYSHLVGAACQLVAMGALVVAVLRRA